MDEKKKPRAVTPRLAEMIRANEVPNIEGDKFTSVADIEDVMSTDMRGRGRMFANSRRHIEENYNAPGFKDDGRGNFVEPLDNREMVKGQAKDEETADNILLKRFDCTHGCNARGSVQPINSTGRDWECSECGFKYEFS